MEVLDTLEEVPAPSKRYDYAAIAKAYNSMDVGRALRLERVYNITSFRQTLERRGVTGEDAQVYQRGNHCFIKRLTDTEMRVG